MEGIRHRVLPFSSKPITSAHQLSLALKEVKNSAAAEGVSNTTLTKCLETAAEKTQIKLSTLSKTSQPVSKSSKGKSRHRCSCGSSFCLCLKTLWLSCLFMLAVCMMVPLYQPASKFVQKTFQDKIFSVVRPIRLGLHVILPYLESVGLDIFTSDCLLENPLLSDVDACHCLHIKEVTVIELDETNNKIPASILDLPTHDVYVVRNATKIDPDLTPDSFQDFIRTRGFPNICAEMSSDSQEGLKLFTDFSDKENMRKHLSTDEPWSFTWEECPDEITKLSFTSLIPKPNYLPDKTHITSSSLFTFSSQWGTTGHIRASFPNSSLVVVLVVMGDVRFMVDAGNGDCESCTSFKNHQVLSAGDILIFDQRYWNYMSVTWTKFAMTYTTAVTKA